MSAAYPLVLGRQLASGTPSVYGASSVVSGLGTEKNPKSQLLEFFQRRQGTPLFTTTPVTRPPADPSFRCVLVCPAVQGPLKDTPIAETRFEGNGRSKKIAEQTACTEALEFYRSRRLIGNYRSVQQTASPVQSPIPISEQPVLYTVASPSPVPSLGSVGEVYHLQPVVSSSAQPVMHTSIVATQPATYTVQQPKIPGLDHVQYVQTVQAGAQPGTGFARSDYMESDDEGLSVDNSDYEERRSAIISCMNLQQARRLGIDALDEILQLRQELFDAQMTLKEHIKIGEKMAELTKHLTQG